MYLRERIRMKQLVNLYTQWALSVFAFVLSASLPLQAGTGPVRSEHVEAELVSEVESIAPGQPFRVAVRLDHDPHWHTYWVNPADSGLETVINWDLPDGFAAGEIQWPYPERLAMGPLVTYGFEREILLMVEITPPEELTPDEPVTLTAQVDWLECKEECIPGDAEFVLTLPVRAEAPELNEEWTDRFTAAQAELPVTDTAWSFHALRTDAGYQLLAVPPDGWDHEIEEAHFFIEEPSVLEYGPDQNWRRTEEGYALDLTRDQTFDQQAETLRGVLVSDDGWYGPDSEKALYVDVDVDDSIAAEGVSPAAAPLEVGVQPEISGMGVALLFAFLGGIVLNLMPCVFPVISMKIMGFVQQAEEDNARILKHGLWFGLGIVASFWVLAGLLIALRAGGEQLGWGFHLQSPPFLIGMSVLFFLLGLNLFGVFEVGTSWMGLGQKASTSSGWTGSFFSGALATLIATPCTAPFMGAALGYALTLSAFQALSVFTFLGLGMAAPYVLLSAFPQWLSRIPKPGAWMESFKQTMGWLFLLFVLYMANVLFAMGGGAAVILLLNIFCVVGIGAWILGRWGTISRGPRVRTTARIIASVLMVGSVGVGLVAARSLGVATADEAVSAEGMPWETFSPERLDELRAEGTPVFINFTAAWCTQCTINERLAFSSQRVQDAFREKGVVALKADWTHRDDVIGAALEGYGRNSVPFYVLYGEGPDAERQTLPQVLFPGTVLSALEEI